MTTMRGLYLANAFAVPGTGRSHHWHFFRAPRNASVKRALVAICGDLRGLKVPPNDHDDIHIAAIADRTWKRHRRTQWRQQS